LILVTSQMKNFIDLQLDVNLCKRELDEFANLLGQTKQLKEQEHVLPFFKQRKHLSGFVGTLVPYIAPPNKLAYEYELFGDFSVDMIVGDSASRYYVLIEFQAGTTNSTFRKKRGKETPEWSPDFETGFSQIVDWLWLLDDMKQTRKFKESFGSEDANIQAILVAGRSTNLQVREKQRLKWRFNKVLVNSVHISALTYDELWLQLDQRYTFESQHWAST